MRIPPIIIFGVPLIYIPGPVGCARRSCRSWAWTRQHAVGATGDTNLGSVVAMGSGYRPSQPPSHTTQGTSDVTYCGESVNRDIAYKR
jgi:hypothetical protein